MDISRVSVPVETRAPTGQTNAYLVGRDDALLVDPPARSDDLDAAVADRDVAHIAATHTHPDHVGAVTHYAESTDATVWAHEAHVERFEAATGREPDATFGDVLETGDGAVRVLDTPGHAPDHVAFVADGHVLCGDLAAAAGSVVVGAPEGDMARYLDSLRRVKAESATRLLPGHGPLVDDPAATLDRLIQHRLDREQRVLDAIKSGATDPDAVLDAAYDKDLSGVRDLARATVVAHIEKLVADGRVVWDVESETVAVAE
ncbi:Glyoxylase, beta-lactamase superfamily II [Halogranum gelatinilyticum]|uniref:Glyoxylase, beta-lactamase superfamily II n=1 Tax=Halogranum gelatinilyticum TaxID=660521 RepID=A0A1G9QI63_9EURY|nr:MBL fold metallo-hydrolase [Halogranum gelatinilyticum]SDM10197.1 Glyoxylase, beta-lactamase superfamily II [Halogranum gelatinilyticum]